ncbi:MAG: hypothetical protein ACE37D_21925 [Pseudomonadales bacterium]|jgi:cell division protein FtsB
MSDEDRLTEHAETEANAETNSEPGQAAQVEEANHEMDAAESDDTSPRDDTGDDENSARPSSDSETDGEAESKGDRTSNRPGAIPESPVHALDATDIDLTEVESQLQSLVPAVIEMSEHVTQASELNNDFRDELDRQHTLNEKSIGRYRTMAEQQRKIMTIVLSACIVVLLISSGLIGITAVSYSKQSNNMNAMSLALSKRIGEVSSGLATFEQINAGLSTMQQSIQNLQLSSEQMRTEVATFNTESQALLDSSLASLSDDIEAQTQSLSDRFALAESEYQSTQESLTQASDAIASLRTRVDSASSKADQLLALQEALDALVVLEQERYLEQLQAQANLNRASENATEELPPNAGLIQYSRVSPDAEAENSGR